MIKFVMTVRFNHPWVDNSRAPILVCDGPDPVDEEALIALMQKWNAWVVETKEPYGWIVTVHKVSARARKALTDSTRFRAPYEKKYCVCMAFVCSSALLRSIHTAILWISTPPVPTAVFATSAEALAWVQQNMRTAAQSPTEARPL
jgi:hypothetical protein